MGNCLWETKQNLAFIQEVHTPIILALSDINLRDALHGPPLVAQLEYALLRPEYLLLKKEHQLAEHALAEELLQEDVIVDEIVIDGS